MANLVGTWDLESSDKWSEYMKELGVGFAMRTAAAAVKPTVVISKNGNKWTLKSVSSLKNTEVTATEGEAFDEKTADGRDSKSLIRLEGEKMIHEQRDPKTGEVKTTVVREVVDNKMICTLTAGKVVCTRVYTRTA